MNNSDDIHSHTNVGLFDADGKFVGLDEPDSSLSKDTHEYSEEEPPDSSIFDGAPSDVDVDTPLQTEVQQQEQTKAEDDDCNYWRGANPEDFGMRQEDRPEIVAQLKKMEEDDKAAKAEGRPISPMYYFGVEFANSHTPNGPSEVDTSTSPPVTQHDQSEEATPPLEPLRELEKDETDTIGPIDISAAAKALNKMVESETEERPMVQAQAKKEPNYASQDLPKMESDKLTPYLTAHKFLKKCEIFSMNGRLYKYDGKKYKYLTEANAESMILRECREDVEAAGTPSFVQSVYRFIVMEKTNPDQERSDAVQTNDEIVSFENGVFHLGSRQLLPHDKKWITLYNIQCSYVFEDLPCPNFEQFLVQATGGYHDLMTRIWQMIGCLQVPHPGRRPFFVLQGVPRSGKSMLGRIIKCLFNPEAVLTLDINAFGRQFAPATLMDKQINISQETENKPLDAKAVSVFKAFTGGDSQTMDVKNKDLVQFSSKASFVMITNHALVVKGGDDALADRAVVIPFQYAVPQEQVDVQLEERIKMEASAIASRGLRAYLAMIDRHEQFAGNYQLNEVTQSGGFNQDPQVSLDDMMIDFFRSSIVKDVSGKLFTEDAYTRFIEQYTTVPPSEFAKIFKKYAKESESIQGRERRQPGANPQSCYTGIQLVDKQDLM